MKGKKAKGTGSAKKKISPKPAKKNDAVMMDDSMESMPITDILETEEEIIEEDENM